MPIRKSSLKALWGFALLALTSQTYAQESATETQAVRCSAAYYVLTGVTAVNPQLGEYFSQMVQQMNLVYAMERQRRSIRITNGDVRARQEVILKELAATYRDNLKAVHQEALLCMSWTETVRAKGGSMDFSAVSPREILPKVINAWGDMVPAAFDAWYEAGAKTPGDFRRDIERSVRENP